MRRELSESGDVARCAWCGCPIRSQPFSIEDDKGGKQVYHEDCYRYGLKLEPERIGWTPIPRPSRGP